MARSKWEDLLPGSGSSGRSRSDLLGQLAESTVGGGVASGGATHSLAGAVQSNASVTDQLSVLATTITSLTSVQQEQISALQDNTQAVVQNSSARSGSGSSVASTVESAASSFLGGGLLSSLSPLLGGVLSLFGGGGGQTLTVPRPFMLPYPVQSQAGVNAGAPGQITPVSTEKRDSRGRKWQIHRRR